MIEEDIKELTAAIQALTRVLQEAPTQATEAPAPTQPAEAPAPAPEPVASDCTVEEVRNYLINMGNTYGAPAQEAIKDILMSVAGTQAFSQVSCDHLPHVLAAAQAWVKLQRTREEQQ